MATKGYAAPEVGQVYARARELCKQMGETPQLFPVLYGLWVFYQVRGEFPTARELGERASHPGADCPRLGAPPDAALGAGGDLASCGRVCGLPRAPGAGDSPV